MLLTAASAVSLLVACTRQEEAMEVPQRSIGVEECVSSGQADMRGRPNPTSGTDEAEPKRSSFRNGVSDDIGEVIERIDTRITGIVMSSWFNNEERTGGFTRFVTAELCDFDYCEQRLYVQWLGGYPRGEFPQFQSEVRMPLNAWVNEMKEFRTLYSCNALEVRVKNVYPGPSNQVWCIDYNDRASIKVLKHQCEQIERCKDK